MLPQGSGVQIEMLFAICAARAAMELYDMDAEQQQERSDYMADKRTPGAWGKNIFVTYKHGINVSAPALSLSPPCSAAPSLPHPFDLRGHTSRQNAAAGLAGRVQWRRLALPVRVLPVCCSAASS